MIKIKTKSGNIILVSLITLGALSAIAAAAYLYWMSNQDQTVINAPEYRPPANQQNGQTAPVTSSADLDKLTTELDNADLNSLDSP